MTTPLQNTSQYTFHLSVYSNVFIHRGVSARFPSRGSKSKTRHIGIYGAVMDDSVEV